MVFVGLTLGADVQPHRRYLPPCTDYTYIVPVPYRFPAGSTDRSFAAEAVGGRTPCHTPYITSLHCALPTPALPHYSLCRYDCRANDVTPRHTPVTHLAFGLVYRPGLPGYGCMPFTVPGTICPAVAATFQTYRLVIVLLGLVG